MRMAELSRASGVPVPTIKYYLRAGLLPPGERTSPNQARYGEAHVRRLRLVRALVEVGKLPIATVAEVLAALDEPASPHHVLGVAQRAVTTPRAVAEGETRERVAQRLREVAERRGWTIKPDEPVTEAVLGVLATVNELGHTHLLDQLDRYAELADLVAESDVDTVVGLPSVEETVEQAVIGMVLGEPLFAALRRLAQLNASAHRFGDPECDPECETSGS
ncbi:DNA-binding transcriptional regulator, MerR family [Amycolatopsis arida]|uniref:DNA-binding transcriptional regulator, MerR family n=1 Tax=Amycolatopsis arida TaxID=587909 RepID=A0A1I5WQN4_9PSEU|nr:MerR family transcriptional regulator [Amycolatopsis arida]TDX92402.1 DNA-binding transcriptional MerR regulator [Amycolatopsis arida]SFQ22102.1 DNA-binding transcriptional regulator, MerR family [Amycolatopsis arida]